MRILYFLYVIYHVSFVILNSDVIKFWSRLKSYGARIFISK